jgi:hypothetical protein
MASYIRAATATSKRLTIVVRDQSVEITDADGRVQTLPTDGKKVNSRAGNGLFKVTTKNRWDHDSLVCQIDLEDFTTIVRTYSLSPGGTELRLTTTVSGRGEPVSLLRFYQRPLSPEP